MATASGYARTVRLWRRGTDPLAAPIIFATDADHMSVWADEDRESEGEERLRSPNAQVGEHKSSIEVRERRRPRGPRAKIHCV